MSCGVLAWNSFCSWVRRRRRNFEATLVMARSSVKISETLVRGIPRWSYSWTVSHRFLLIVVFIRSIFSGDLLSKVFQNIDHLRRDSWPSLKRLWHISICASLLESSWNTLLPINIVSAEECSSLQQNLTLIRWSTLSAIVNATFKQYTPSLNCDWPVTEVSHESIVAHACAVGSSVSVRQLHFKIAPPVLQKIIMAYRTYL